MSALPGPELPPGAAKELNDALHELHHRAGWPSLRTLARETGVSHTTVSKAFSRPTLPSWGTLELLVEAMGGEAAVFHDLWLAASSPISGGATPPRIAGRRAELDVVRRHLETGTGLLLVTGEAGIGKTTLVRAAAATTDVFVTVGHCLPLSREMPLMPVVDALRGIHELDGGEWLEKALSQSPGYVRRSLARLLPELDSAAAVPPDDPWGLERLFASVATTLRALSGISPVVVHLEDCHWADRSTLDLLTHVASVSSEPPVVVTWRTGDPDVESGPTEWLSRTRWAPTTTAVDLEPLTLQETAEQLRLLEVTGTDDHLAERIHARARGLPLYTAQLAASPAAEGLPSHLADLLDRRIGDLDDEAWRVARVLGLAQRPVGPGILRESAALSADAVDDALRVLAGRRLLGTREGDEAELAHPLLVDAIERRLMPGEAAEVHARIAEALVSAPGIQPGEVADHWRAAGLLDREVAHRASAALRAQEHFASEEALDSWLRVLELWDDGHRDADIELWDILARALDAAVETGELDTGRVLAVRAESLDLSDRERAQVLQRIGSLLYELGEVTRAEEILDESLRLLEQSATSADLLPLLGRRFWMFQQSGRYIEAQVALDRSLDLLDPREDSGRRRRMLAGLTLLTMDSTGDVEASLAIAGRALDTELAEPDPIADLMVAASATDILIHAPSSAARAEQFARRALREAEAWGVELSFPAVLVRTNVCCAHLWGGDVRAAGEWIRPITHSDPGINTAFAHVMLAAVEMREGDLDAAGERCRAADAQMLNRNENWAEVVPWIADVELWGGRPEGAAELLAQALDSRLGSEAAGQTGPLLVALARARADLLDAARSAPSHRRRAARELRGRVTGARDDPFAPGLIDAAVPALAASWQAEVSRVEATTTVEAWVRAAKAWDHIARPHDAAYCRWRAAQCALRDDQGTVAARLLRRAATDAHQHVPLSEAIAATARSGR